MTDGTVKGTKKLTSANTQTNALMFLIEMMLRDTVNTAEVVTVTGVDTGGPESMTGYVDVMPLVCQTDADNNALPPATIFRLPYSRIHGGVAALVIDPVPGDIGLAVFCKRDSSGVKQAQATPVQPASFRIFDQADGYYFGGFLNKAPEIWLELNQDREAVLHAPVRVTIETQECVVDAPNTYFTGNAFIDGNLSWGGSGYGYGNRPASFRGGLDNQGGTIKSNDKTLDNHTHPNGMSGTTGAPNTGT